MFQRPLSLAALLVLVCCLSAAAEELVDDGMDFLIFDDATTEEKQPQPFNFGIFQFPVDHITKNLTGLRIFWEIPVDSITVLKQDRAIFVPNDEGKNRERQYARGNAVLETKVQVQAKDAETPQLDTASNLVGPIDDESEARGFTYLVVRADIKPDTYRFRGGLNDYAAYIENEVVEESDETLTKRIFDYSDPENLHTSDVILARSFKALSSRERSQAEKDPKLQHFIYGDFLLYPNVAASVPKGDELYFYFQVTNISKARRTQGSFNYSYRFVRLDKTGTTVDENGNERPVILATDTKEVFSEGAHVAFNVPTEGVDFFEPGGAYRLEIAVKKPRANVDRIPEGQSMKMPVAIRRVKKRFTIE